MAGLVGSCSPAETSRRPNVLLICLDTVRADHLGCYGHRTNPTTPFLDELAARSYLFEDASSTAGWTKPSVPSFLTGTYPCQHGVYEGSARFEEGATTDVLPAKAVTLAEVFQERGYRTAAFIRNSQLRPGNGFEQGFDVFLDEVGDAKEIRWAGLDWLDSLGEETPPFFLYLHFLDAHWPWPVPDEYATMFGDPEELAPLLGKSSGPLIDAVHDGAPLTADQARALTSIYDGALRYLDDQLRVLLEGLRIRGLDEDTIVCVVSDHGEEFGEHGRIGHGHGLWENLLHVPWILHVPGAEPRRLGDPVSLVDLFPTLLGAAGIPFSHRVEGVDRLRDPRAARPILAEHKAPDRYEQTLRDSGRKLLREFADTDRGAPVKVFPLRAGERWEAELERADDGTLRVTQLKPRPEDEVDDPLEVRGPISRFAGSRFEIGGIDVEIGEHTSVSPTDEAADGELFDGRVVKARGELMDGRLVADRVKVYARDESSDLEIRGEVLSVEREGFEGRLEISGMWVRFDEETDFKGVDVREKPPPMSRTRIVELLEAGAEALPAGLAPRFTLFDLGTDPGELGGTPADAQSPLSRVLDELGRALVPHRVFSEDDRLLLTEEALERLQDIGYAK